MEEKARRTPGICRIFSLSLNQAISNKDIPTSNTSRASKDSLSTSPENDKANDEKKDGFPDRHFRTDSYPRHGSAYRQSVVRSSENKDKRAEADSKGSSNVSKESCKKSPHVSSSFSDTKRRVETSRKTVLYSGNSSSGKKTVTSSRTQSVGEKSSACVPLEASSVLQATNTHEKNNDIDPAFVTLPSEDATHDNCAESSSIKTDISPQSDKSVSGKRDFDDKGPLKTVYDSSGHVPKDGRFNRKQSSSFGLQRETGSFTTEARSHDGRPKSKSISDKKDDKYKKNRKDSYGKQTQNDQGETGKSSVSGQCPKTQTEKRPDHCSGSRGGTYDKQQLQHLPGKWSNRSRGSGYQSAHCESERGLKKSVSIGYGCRKVLCPPQSASTGRASSGRGKGTIVGVGRNKYKEYREADWDEVSSAGSSRPNSAGSRTKDDPSTGHTLHSTAHSQVQQRRQNHGTDNVDGNAGQSLPTQHASHSESALLMSSSAPLDEDDWDSKASDVESSGGIKTQGDCSAVHDKSQTCSQTESTDTSEVEVWCDVKEEMSKQECGTDVMQVMGSCVENVSTMTVLDTGCDSTSLNEQGSALSPWSATEKPDNSTKLADSDAKSTTHLAQTQPVNIAKMRQANVTTRMRGNSRVKSCINRMKMTDDASRDSALKEEAHSKDLTKSRCDQHSLVKSVDDTICEANPSETGEKTPVEFLSESFDEDKSSKEPCVQETMDPVNDCSNKNPYNNKGKDFHAGKNQTLTGWKTVPDKSSNSSDSRERFCDKDSHGKNKEKIEKAPPPLMSLQTKPSASLYDPVVLKSEDYGWSSDSCVIPSNQHHTSLQKSSAGFGRTKVRSGSTVSSSSSSYAPLSTTNSLSQNENLSCSSSSYASLVSDDFKDAGSLETSFSKKEEDSKVGGSKWECFSSSHNLPQSSTCSSVGNSKDEEESQAANCSKHTSRLLSANSHRILELSLQESHDSSQLSCSPLESGVIRQSSEVSVSSKLQYSYTTDSDSHHQQDKVRPWKGMSSLCSSDDQSACGDTDRDQLSSYTFEFDAHTHRRTERISRESSTETVTETPDVELLSYDASGNRAFAENLAGRSVSGASLCFQSNGDSDFQVSSPVYSDEPVLISKKCIADVESFDSICSEYSQVEAENVQQSGRSTMFRKQRPGKGFPRTRCKNLEFDQEQVIRNKHGQALESNDCEASGAANSKMNPPVKKCKETNEKRHARLKDGGDCSLTAQSASSSECSESVSVVSDYVCAGSDSYLKGTDSFDQRCQTWIKETERWPANTKGPTESDSNNSFLSDFKEKMLHGAQKHSVYEDESWIDSDSCPPLGSSSCMAENHTEEQDWIESETSPPAHKQFQPTEQAQKWRGRSLHQRTTSTSQDAGDSQSTAPFADQECNVSKIRVPRSHLEAKERQTVSDRRDSAYSKPGHFIESCKNLKCPGTKLCRGHGHSLCDIGNTKIQTSGSSDCDVDVLSQSDYDDPSAQLPGKAHGNKADKRPSSADQSSQASASNEHWPSLYQNHPVPGYPSYIPKTHAQSCYPSYYPETDMWVPPHHSYYEQWYHAWMAYSMGFYGYGFQEGEQDMDFSKAFRRQNCGCASTCHQQHSGPPSRPLSQPPSRPPSSQDNPILRDPRAAHDVNPIQSEKSDSQQCFRGNQSGENSGGHFPGVRRGETSGRQYFEYFHGDGNDVGSRGQYFQGDRSDESSEVHDRKSISTPSVPEGCSQNVQNHVTKEPPASYGRSNVSSETPARVKREEGDPQNQAYEDESSACRTLSENRNTQNEPVTSDSSGIPNPAEELMNHTNSLREQSMNTSGNNFFRCRSKTPLLTPYGPGSRLSQYRGDFSSWPGFSPHAFRLPPPMMMATMMPTFRFCRLPRPYQGFSPPEASSSSSCGGKEEKKETPLPENCPNKQQWYKDYKDLHAVHASNMFHRNLSNEWSLRPQHPLLPPQHVQPPPPPHIPQGPKEMVSQTSCSLETTSSEPCHLDSSFDTRGDYDASSSEMDNPSRAETASSKRKRTELNEVGFDKFVAAQRQRYLQMYKDSGSDELDSSSAPSSKQSNTTRLSNDPDENNSSGSGVTPKRQESGTKSVLHSLHRRAIPFNNRDRNRRSCPPKVETAPTATADKAPESEKKTRPWDLGLQTPPPGLSYAQAVSSPGAWWDQSHQSESPLCEEDFPTLSAAASLPKLPALSSSKPQTLSQACSAEEKGAASSTNGNVAGKSFFRKKSSEQSGWSRGGKMAMSRYASRLMSDNRLSGRSRWDKETREAFGEAYQTTFIDTHCHIDFLFNREPYKGTYASYQEKNKSTFPSNYEGCVAVFCRPKTFRNESKWKPIVEEPGVWMAMGCHPKNAPEYTEWTEEGLLKALKHSKTVALGEIGLDYSKHHGQTSDVQKEVFIRQIKIALSMNLPLVIHCREAEDDCLQILEEHVPADYKIHCHCFTTNYDSALKWTSRFKNLFIGLTPLVTYRSAVDVHQVARHLPLTKLLLETDAPYFLPTGFEGEDMSLSHPGMALTVAIRVAELRGIQVEEVLTHVRRNTKEMYGI